MSNTNDFTLLNVVSVWCQRETRHQLLFFIFIYPGQGIFSYMSVWPLNPCCWQSLFDHLNTFFGINHGCLLNLIVNHFNFLGCFDCSTSVLLCFHWLKMTKEGNMLRGKAKYPSPFSLFKPLSGGSTIFELIILPVPFWRMWLQFFLLLINHHPQGCGRSLVSKDKTCNIWLVSRRHISKLAC